MLHTCSPPLTLNLALAFCVSVSHSTIFSLSAHRHDLTDFLLYLSQWLSLTAFILTTFSVYACLHYLLCSCHSCICIPLNLSFLLLICFPYKKHFLSLSLSLLFNGWDSLKYPRLAHNFIKYYDRSLLKLCRRVCDYIWNILCFSCSKFQAQWKKQQLSLKSRCCGNMAERFWSSFSSRVAKAEALQPVWNSYGLGSIFTHLTLKWPHGYYLRDTVYA